MKAEKLQKISNLGVTIDGIYHTILSANSEKYGEIESDYPEELDDLTNGHSKVGYVAEIHIKDRTYTGDEYRINHGISGIEFCYGKDEEDLATNIIMTANKRILVMKNKGKSTGIKDREKTLEVLEGFILRGKASISDAQRYHKLGYNRATKIFAELGRLGLLCEAEKGNEAVIDIKHFKQLKENSHEID